MGLALRHKCHGSPRARTAGLSPLQCDFSWTLGPLRAPPPKSGVGVINAAVRPAKVCILPTPKPGECTAANFTKVPDEIRRLGTIPAKARYDQEDSRACDVADVLVAALLCGSIRAVERVENAYCNFLPSPAHCRRA